MSRPRFDVAGLWEHDPAPQHGDEGRGPGPSNRAVQAAPSPRPPTPDVSREQAAVRPPVLLPPHPRDAAQWPATASHSRGKTASPRTATYVSATPDAWLLEASRFANPVWPPHAVSKWPRQVTCLSVSTTGKPNAAWPSGWSSGWSVGFGLVSLMFPFVAWAGGGWSGPAGSAPFFAAASWTVGAAPMWPNRNGAG